MEPYITALSVTAPISQNRPKLNKKTHPEPETGCAVVVLQQTKQGLSSNLIHLWLKLVLRVGNSY